MSETLPQLLLRLSEAGDPALVWGRQAKLYLGRDFDRVLSDRILIEQSPAENWPVCADCDCGLDDRPIHRCGGCPVAVCPLDRRADTVLDEDDLRLFRIDRGRLVAQMAAATGFASAPSEVISGVWRLGSLDARPVYLGLDRTALLRAGVVSVIRTIDSSGPVSLVGPSLAAADQIRLREAGFELIELRTAFASVGSGPLTLDSGRIVSRSGVVRLALTTIARSVMLDGTDMALSDQNYRLLLMLAERVLAGKPFMTPREIEDRIYGSSVHRVQREAKDIVRELRDALDAHTADAGAKLIENQRSRGYRLALTSVEIDLAR